MKPPVDAVELKPLFYWAGLALFSCQQLEYGAKVLLVTLADFGFCEFRLDEAIAIIEDEQKKTLGQVLRCIQQHVNFSDVLTAKLEAGLKSRNHFIHGFLTDSLERIADPAARDGVIADLKAIRETVLAGDSAVRQILAALSACHGLDLQKLKEHVEDELRALNSLADVTRKSP